MVSISKYRAVIGSNPIIRNITRLAQLVERTPFKRVAVGSSPTSGARAVRDALPKSPKMGNRGIFHLTMELLVNVGNINED